MNTLILKTAARFLVTLMLLYSLFLLLRGHDNPGGGFVGGLVAAAAWSLYAIAFGCEKLRHAFTFEPQSAVGAGFIVILVSALLGPLQGEPLLTGQWITIPLGEKGLKLGSPLLFDFGIYLVVLGSIISIVSALEEEYC